jgi:hypothetical protein
MQQTAEIGGAALVIVLVAVLAAFCVQSLFLLLGARIAGIEHRSFGRALGTTILGGIASSVFAMGLSIAVPGLGTFVGSIAGFFVSALIMMPMFRTTYGKALGATVLAWVLGLVIIGGVALLVVLAGGIAFLTAQ